MQKWLVWLERRLLICTVAVMLALQATAPPATGAMRLSLYLTARSPGAHTQGQATVIVRRLRRGLDGTLLVVVRNLDAHTTYEIVVRGVRIGTLTTNGRGRGRARFRTHPRGHDQLLGVDPRGKRIAVHTLIGSDTLKGVVPEHAGRAGAVRCCVPEEKDEAPECERVTAEKCQAKEGMNLGAGSCMPSPCPPPPPPPQKTRCCVPEHDNDDEEESEVECKQRTPAWCAQKGGVDIGPGRCDDRACPPTPPPNRIQCCVPEDDENECKLLTPEKCHASDGTSLGTGTCDPDPCPPPKIRCCIPEDEEDENEIECKQRTPEKCDQQGGANIGPGSCEDNPCAAVSTTTTTTSTTTTTTRTTTTSTSTSTTTTTPATTTTTTTTSTTTSTITTSTSTTTTTSTVITTTTTTSTTTTTIDCRTLCGNGQIDPECNEACDGSSVGGAFCPGALADGTATLDTAQETPTPFLYTASLDAAQEVPTPTVGTPPPTGTASFALNADHTLRYSVSVQNLSGRPIAAHIHQAPAGTPGPVIVPLDTSAVTGTSGTFSGTSTVALTDAQVTALQAGGLYVNVHTTANSAGEIRGQIAALTPATGSAQFRVNADKTLTYTVRVQDLSGPPRAAHVHQGDAGVPGPVVIPLDPSAVTGTSGTFSGTSAPLSDALVSAFKAGGLYVNVHTALNGSGEIRGQIAVVNPVTCNPDCTLNFEGCTTTSTTTTTTTTTSTTTTTPAMTSTITSTTTTSTSITTTTSTTTTSITTTTSLPQAVSFTQNVAPILAANCTFLGCHAPPFLAQGMDLSSAASAYAVLTTKLGTEVPCIGTPLVVPGSPDASVLMMKLASTTCGFSQMPLGGQPLSATDITTIRDWIAEGAPNN